MRKNNTNQTTFSQLGNFVVRFFLWIYYWGKYFAMKHTGTLPVPIKVETTTDILEKKYKKQLDIFRNQSDKEANSNIDSFMYNYEERKQRLTEIGNLWEKQWHRRVLVEKYPDELSSMPSGKNIIMRFDPYSNAFQYYSDESVVSYNILNYIAIKYVVTYFCRDFFIDTLLHPSNLMYQQYLKEEDNALISKRPVKELNGANVFVDSSKKTSTMNSTPFSKVMDEKMNNVKKENRDKTARLYSNSFVRLGKIADFNILQTPPKVKANQLLFGDNCIHKKMNYFDESLEIDMPIDEPVVTKPIVEGKMSYKDFKKLNAVKT